MQQTSICGLGAVAARAAGVGLQVIPRRALATGRRDDDPRRRRTRCRPRGGEPLLPRPRRPPRSAWTGPRPRSSTRTSTLAIDDRAIRVKRAVASVDSAGRPRLDDDGRVIPQATTIYDAAMALADAVPLADGPEGHPCSTRRAGSSTGRGPTTTRRPPSRRAGLHDPDPLPPAPPRPGGRLPRLRRRDLAHPPRRAAGPSGSSCRPASTASRTAWT